jgi:hypothetical protein
MMRSLASAGGAAPHSRVVISGPSAVVVRPAPRIFAAKPSVSATVVSPQFFPKFGPPVIVTGPFFPVVVSVPPALVVAEPVVFVPPPIVGAPALPTPILIEYPTGWYQLRGDGGRTPYQWVWIPRPPPPPPSEAPPTVPPASPFPMPANPPTMRSAEPRSSPVPRELYRWTDEHGVAHLTDSLEDIPERHRSTTQRGGWSMEPDTLRPRH